MNDAMRSKSGAPDAASGKSATGTADFDTTELARQLARVAKESEHLVADFLKRQGTSDGVGLANTASIGAAAVPAEFILNNVTAAASIAATAGSSQMVPVATAFATAVFITRCAPTLVASP